MSRWVRVLAVAALVAAFLPAVPARADTPAATGIHLEYQDPTVKVGHAFSMLFHIDDPHLVNQPGARISLRVGQSISTRSEFDAAIQSNHLTRVLYEPEPIPVSSLGRLGGNLAVTLGLPGSDAEHTINIRNSGVYPMEVSLLNTGTPTSPFITWIVVTANADEPIPEPLRVAMIWQLSAPPATLPDGSNDPAVVAAMQPSGRLDHIATVLDRHGRTPVSLVVTPETVETWSKLATRDASLARGLDRVRAAAQQSTTEMLPAPYVPIDLPALEAAGLGDELPHEIVDGAKTLHDVLGAPITSAQNAFVDPSSAATIDRLWAMRITRVAVRDTALVPVPNERTPARGFTLPTSTNPPDQAVQTAPFVEQLLDGPDAPAVKAQRVVAALAEVAYEEPAIARGLVLATPTNWSPDVDAMTKLVDALRHVPLVKPVTLDDLFAQITFEHGNVPGAQRQLKPTATAPMPITAPEFEAAAARLHAYEAVAGPDDAASVAGEHALLLALSTSITPERARAELRRVEASVNAFTNAVSVDARRIQLTSARASIPLSFENRLDPPRPIRVVVHLESPKLVFPDGADREIELKPGTTTVRAAADGQPFSVEARTPGTFALTIRITSVDGSLQFGSPARVTVRSTVFGRLAAPITIAALLVLAFWWGNHFRRTRRARRLAPATAT
jgi:hypothetical protein